MAFQKYQDRGGFCGLSLSKSLITLTKSLRGIMGEDRHVQIFFDLEKKIIKLVPNSVEGLKRKGKYGSYICCRLSDVIPQGRYLFKEMIDNEVFLVFNELK